MSLHAEAKKKHGTEPWSGAEGQHLKCSQTFKQCRDFLFKLWSSSQGVDHLASRARTRSP